LCEWVGKTFPGVPEANLLVGKRLLMFKRDTKAVKDAIGFLKKGLQAYASSSDGIGSATDGDKVSYASALRLVGDYSTSDNFMNTANMVGVPIEHDVYSRSGEWLKALVSLRRLTRTQLERLPATHRDQLRLDEAQLLIKLGRTREGIDKYQKFFNEMSSEGLTNVPLTSKCRVELAESYAIIGEMSSSRKVAAQALEELTNGSKTGWFWREGYSLFWEARAHWLLGEHRIARTLLRRYVGSWRTFEDHDEASALLDIWQGSQ